MRITTRKREARRLEKIVAGIDREADDLAGKHENDTYIAVCATHAAGQRMGAHKALARFRGGK